jgi:hypothetical protein
MDEGGGAVLGIGGGMGTGGGSPVTRPLGIGQGPTKKKNQKGKKPIVRSYVGYQKNRKAS